MRTGCLPASHSTARQVLLQHDNFIEIEGILYHLSRDLSSKYDSLVAQVAIPQVWVPQILRSYHDTPLGGHMGVMKLLSVLRERFFWEGMNKDVREYVATCHECLKAKKSRNTIIAPMTLRSKVTQPFQAVTMDTVGPVHRSKSGKLYIHVCVDFLSKYLIAWPSASIDAATTAKGFYEHVIAVHGVPQKLCTDNGTSYTGQIFRDACKEFGIAQVFSSSWHPQSKVWSKERIRPLLPDYVPLWIRDSNTLGYSPYRMLYGRQPCTPTETQFPQFDSRLSGCEAIYN